VAKVRLDSWKSIAEYLRRSPRTVQRWHAEYGLPVHRFGGTRGPVFSYREELDSWLSGFVEKPGEDRDGADEFPGDRKRKAAALVAQADEMWELRTEDNLSAIAALYRSAIDHDPANAAAFVGLSNVLVLSALVGAMTCAAAYPRAAEALRRAARGGDTPSARCAAAWLQMMWERSWKRAREGFEQALGDEPRSSHALAGRALLHVAEGNLKLAARCLEDAWRENTFASASTAFLGWVQYLAGAWDQAIDTARQARASGDNGAIGAAVESLALLHSGPVSKNLKRLEEVADASPRSLVVQAALGYACAVTHHLHKAQEILNNLKRMKGDAAYPLAIVLLGLDDANQAMSCVEASYAEGSLWSIGFRWDPLLHSLRTDPRFEARLLKLGP
jgi:tetratricopeptide (TPR) repeat protein